MHAHTGIQLLSGYILNNLSSEMYVNDISSKTTVCDKEPTILLEKAGSAYVDGENLLGPVVGNFSMQLAIKKAKQAGIGWVTAKGKDISSTHTCDLPTNQVLHAIFVVALAYGMSG